MMVLLTVLSMPSYLMFSNGRNDAEKVEMSMETGTQEQIDGANRRVL